MNRFHTDFLCSTTSFLGGLGSVMNLSGRIYEYNRTQNPDEVALAHDWEMIAQDFRASMEKFRSESGIKQDQ